MDEHNQHIFFRGLEKQNKKEKSASFLDALVSLLPLKKKPANQIHESSLMRLVEEQKRIVDFMDNALVGFFSVNKEGRFVFANSTFARWLGYKDPKDVLGLRLHEFLVHPPKKGEEFDVFENGGAKQFGEIKIKTRTGKEFDAAIAHAIVYDDEYNVTSQTVIRDLTKERSSVDQTKESQDRFHRFFEDAPTGILLVNNEGFIEVANQAFLDLIHKKDGSISGKKLMDLVDPNDHFKIIDLLKRLEKEDFVQDHIEIKFKQPIIGTAQVFAGRLREQNGFIFHFHDLTKQKQLEVQFTQSQKMQAVGQLAGGVAHDFNNLLTAMIGFCDLLLERHRPGDASFQDIMQIKQNANRAANLVRQLLAFSRQQTLRPQKLDVTDVLIDLSHLLRRLIGVNIELNLLHGRDIWPIKADQGQMDQVIINLVVNARDAMSGKGVITIESKNHINDKPRTIGSETMAKGEWVLIRIEDQGCGIPPENLSRIFDPFFTTKALGEGTGLGLSTVYGIIRQTGGFLTVESEVGKGTTFSIYLPKLSQEDSVVLEQETDKERKTSDLTGSERILLVEDEEAVRKFSARALTSKGYEVIEAENGKVALDLFEQLKGPVDLVISDVMMPEVDGPTMAKEMQAKYPDLKVLFVSGFTEDRISDYQNKNVFFLAKPFTLKQLASKVKDVLEANKDATL